MSSLVLRILSSLVMVPLVLGAIFGGYPFFDLLLLVVGAMWCWEWATMVDNKNPALYAIVYTIAMMFSISSLATIMMGLWIAVVAVCGLFVAYKARKEQYPLLLVLGTLYISVGMHSLSWVYEIGNELVTLWLILAVWSVDVGGYVFGSWIKGPKLAPRISPKKTWSGLIGGVLLATVVCGLFMHWFVPKDIWYVFTGLAAILAIVAQIGDLCESAIKRYLGIKDSSNLIPGHGGIFDRIDGLVFAAPFFCVFSMLIPL